MQNEFDAENAALPIQIIGLNESDKTTTDSFTSDRDLPWLQDTVDQSVWKEWNIQYRDVLILDATNEPVMVFNLTQYNLSDSENYETVKTAFEDLANAP
jgi:hypothetical protein